MYRRSDNSDSTASSHTHITGQSGKLPREGIRSEAVNQNRRSVDHRNGSGEIRPMRRSQPTGIPNRSGNGDRNAEFSYRAAHSTQRENTENKRRTAGAANTPRRVPKRSAKHNSILRTAANCLTRLAESHRVKITVAVCALVAVFIPIAAVYASSEATPDFSDFNITDLTLTPENVLKTSGIAVDQYSLLSANTEQFDAKTDNSASTVTLTAQSTGTASLESSVAKSSTASSSAALSDANRYSVTVKFFGRDSISATTGEVTVRQFFEAIGYTLTASDRIYVGLDDLINSDMTIVVDTVSYTTDVAYESIPYETETIDSQTIPRGTTQTVTAGVCGKKDTVYSVECVNGVEVSRTQQSSYVETYPTNQVDYHGVGGVVCGSDGTAHSYSYYVTVRATYYDLPGTTATGMPVGDNVIATDPSFIPLGTNVFLANSTFDMGVRVAADTGGAVKG